MRAATRTGAAVAWWRGVREDARTSRKEPLVLAAAGALAVLLFLFILLPIGTVLVKSFQTRDGTFTLDNYLAFFSRRFYYRALINSVVLSVSTTAIVLVIGLAFALLVTRTGPVLQLPLRGIALLPLVAPPFIFSLSLIIIGGRRGLIARALGVEFSLYGWPGVLIAQAISFLPLAYLMIENVLRSVDPNVEEAASDLGAGQPTILRTVTLPLIAPGLLKAALLVFIMAIADFGNPMLIGGGLSFLATDAYLLIIGEQNMPMGSVLGVFLILPALVVFLIHQRYLRGKVFTTVGGAPISARRRALVPAIRIPLLALCLAMATVVLATFGLVVLGAFTEIIMVRNRFTLDHFRSGIGWEAMKVSLKMSLAAALVSAILGVVLAYLLGRRRIPGRGLMEFVALFGLAVPGTVMGIGYILIFNRPPLILTGTLAILVLNCAFRELPVGLEAGISKLQQIDPAIEEASRDLGAGAFVTFRRIVLPLIRSAFTAGLIYTFMVGMITVSAVIFLVSPGMNLASVYILNLAEAGSIGPACALAVGLIAVVVTCLSLLKLVARGTGFEVGGTV